MNRKLHLTQEARTILEIEIYRYMFEISEYLDILRKTREEVCSFWYQEQISDLTIIDKEIENYSHEYKIMNYLYNKC